MIRMLLVITVVFWGHLTGFYAQQAYGQGEESDQTSKHVVFLISKDPHNYEADRTIPAFATMLENKYGYWTTVILGKGKRTSFHFPGLEVLSKADLVVVFARRVALKADQMNRIKQYLNEGNPLLGIRTANHAFSVRKEVKEGYTDWWDFVPDILGCKNRGYGPVELGTDISVVPEAKDHPILKQVQREQWHSEGNVYHVAPLLDDQAKVLLRGRAGDEVEPIAWFRTTDTGALVFYTSLGHPTDFEDATFRQLLTNAVQFLISKGGFTKPDLSS